MSNINDSFIRISEIMRNSILRFDISAEVKESITSLKQINRGQPRNKGHSKQAIFWWLKN